MGGGETSGGQRRLGKSMLKIPGEEFFAAVEVTFGLEISIRAGPADLINFLFKKQGFHIWGGRTTLLRSISEGCGSISSSSVV